MVSICSLELRHLKGSSVDNQELFRVGVSGSVGHAHMTTSCQSQCMAPLQEYRIVMRVLLPSVFSKRNVFHVHRSGVARKSS